MQTDEQIMQIFRDLRDIYQTAKRKKAANVTQGEKQVLHYLRQIGGQAQPGEISRAMNISTARVAAILGSLARKEQIIREPLGTDRRCVQVRLTEAGNARLDALYDRMSEMMTYILQSLGPEDARDFCRILHRLPGIMHEFANNNQKGEI